MVIFLPCFPIINSKLIGQGDVRFVLTFLDSLSFNARFFKLKEENKKKTETGKGVGV